MCFFIDIFNMRSDVNPNKRETLIHFFVSILDYRLQFGPTIKLIEGKRFMLVRKYLWPKFSSASLGCYVFFLI